MNHSSTLNMAYRNFQINSPLALIAGIIFTAVLVPLFLLLTGITASIVWLYVRAKKMFGTKTNKTQYTKPNIEIKHNPTAKDLREAEYIDFEIVE